MSFFRTPCTPSDVPQMISIYLSAFATDPFTAHAFPPSIPPSELNRWLTTRFTAQFQKRWIRMIKITADSPTGPMCAFLRYQVPHTLTPAEKSQQEAEAAFKASERLQGRDPEWPLGANLGLIDEKFSTLRTLQKKYVDEAEFYVAHLLATHPSHQRKGLGTMLLREMLDQADREGRKAYIEATEAGYPVYCKLGWKDLDVLYVDLGNWGGEGVRRNRILIREPVVVEKLEELEEA